MPKGGSGVDGDEDPRRQALVGRVDAVTAHLLQQPGLDVRRRDRDRLDHGDRRRTEARHPGEHGVTDGGRDLGATAGEDLADVERVSRRSPVQLAGVDPGAMRELGHCLR